jgi:hypothetical protein
LRIKSLVKGFKFSNSFLAIANSFSDSSSIDFLYLSSAYYSKLFTYILDTLLVISNIESSINSIDCVPSLKVSNSSFFAFICSFNFFSSSGSDCSSLFYLSVFLDYKSLSCKDNFTKSVLNSLYLLT